MVKGCRKLFIFIFQFLLLASSLIEKTACTVGCKQWITCNKTQTNRKRKNKHTSISCHQTRSNTYSSRPLDWWRTQSPVGGHHRAKWDRLHTHKPSHLVSSVSLRKRHALYPRLVESNVEENSEIFTTFCIVYRLFSSVCCIEIVTGE